MSIESDVAFDAELSEEETEMNDSASESASKEVTTRKHQLKPGNVLEGFSHSDISDTMFKMINFYTAPAIDIDVFDGKILDYQYFRATFTDLVETKIPDQKGRLVRLIKYTSD